MSEKKRETKKGKRLFLILAAFAFTILLLGAASACLSQNACCNMVLTKSVDKINVKPGDSVTFTLKYKNIGDGDCTGTGVKIQDVLNYNLDYMGSYITSVKNDVDGMGVNYSWYEIPGYDETTNTLTWNAHLVSPGEEGTITFEVEVLKPEQCGCFEVSNFFKDWSDQRGWQYSNTITLFLDNPCECPRCGDGIINQANETCDDGNTNNNDGCSATCKIESCGDGIINQANETCDDGNLNNLDLCRNNCKLPYCGDSIKDNNEQCDDGNSVNGDGCSTQCTTETLPYCGDGNLNLGEECDDGNSVNTDSCRNNCKLPYCGDNIKDNGEQCDDGNLVNGDGCSAQCTTETLPYCGDENLDEGEECDDGNLVNGDGCSAECEIEFNQCIYNISVRKAYANSFGTGIAINNSETYNWVSETPALLKKGLHKIRYYVDNHEQEDNNASITVKLDSTILLSYFQNIDSSHYKTLILDTTQLGCNSFHNISVDIVSESNGICTDDNPSDNHAKRAILIECEGQHYCGDGNLDIGEECDLGTHNGEGCTPAYGGICSYCSDECEEIILTDGYCGDDLIQPQYEECDDGNLVNGDGCSANCEREFNPCIYNISVRTTAYANSFGTGIAINNSGTYNWVSETPALLKKGLHKIRYYVDNHEQEDNNASITVKLDNIIIYSFHGFINVYDSETLTLDTSNLQCDSLHNITIDVVSESNGICTDDNPSDNHAKRAILIKCEEQHYCGDGNLNIGEECDDHNNVNNDGCSSTCKTEKCGDGIKQTSEGCDDGNTNNLDSCRNTCKLPYCGDSIKDSKEYCDDGNQVNGDGCSKTCRFECPNGICTPNITIEDFIPRVWLCDSRVVYDDATEPGRISTDGQPLVERINNYAFEGEQISWKVLVMDKNGIDKLKDVYVTVDNYIEANCKRITEIRIDPTCNARILEEEITEFNPKTMSYYLCTLTIETPESMYGQSDITVEAEDLYGNLGTMDETETWFLNPSVSLEIQGGITFSSLRPGTTEYSGNVILTNDAESDSGVILDMFISGTNFYDSSSSGAKCPTTNQLSLNRVGYYATNGAYSTLEDMEIGRTCDSEGYCRINYGIGFNNPYRFYDRNEIIQAQKLGPYYTANLLSPGADMSIVFRVNVPEPCIGNFDSGHIYFWGEAV